MIAPPFTQPVVMRNQHPLLILDSGAYSVWQSGATISFERYERYVRTVKNKLLVAVNLDRIAGTSGRRATIAETRFACELSYRNWLRLLKTGAPLMPVYHQDDPPEWLYEYLAQGARFLGISPNGAYPDDSRKRWLIETHELLERTGALGREFFTHGLGVFAPGFLPQLGGLMWSADASSLMRLSAFYRLCVPLDEHGEITRTGPVTRLRKVFVGHFPQSDEHRSTVWPPIREYLDAIGLQDDYEHDGERLSMSIHAVTSANAFAARLVMYGSDVRCFMAGPDLRVMHQLTVAEQWPYILRSFAQIDEDSGSTVEQFYLRAV